MEHDVEALPIPLSILADLAQKSHAYAKALHYRELEFQSQPAASFESLVNINKKLDQYDAAGESCTHTHTHKYTHTIYICVCIESNISSTHFSTPHTTRSLITHTHTHTRAHTHTHTPTIPPQWE